MWGPVQGVDPYDKRIRNDGTTMKSGEKRIRNGTVRMKSDGTILSKEGQTCKVDVFVMYPNMDK